MCGIVHRPTRRKDLDPTRFPNLLASSVSAIATVCEDVHIPHLATELVLRFANKMVGKENFVLEVIPFAVYENGKRIISRESVEAEQAVMHLAMAGSVRRIINHELGKAGLVLELAHCCGIEMWEKSREEEASLRSHDKNVYRADKLRALKNSGELTVSATEFVGHAQGFDEELLETMLLLAKREAATVN